MKAMKAIGCVAVMAAGMMLAVGCVSESADKARASAAKPIENPQFERFEVNLPPKQLLEVARRVVTSAPWSLQITSEGKGVMATGWKEYRGAFHIVRYWQERTRFQVTVTPDFDDPAGKSEVRVAQETETRASDQGHWVTLLDEDRTDRAVELAKAIQAEAQKQGAGR